jgi:hypothetical protein
MQSVKSGALEPESHQPFDICPFLQFPLAVFPDWQLAIALDPDKQSARAFSFIKEIMLGFI